MPRFKLGRRQPVARQPVLRLRNYLLRTLPPPPPSVDYSSADTAGLSDPYGNDICGDCTCAAAFHVGSVLLANSGQPIPWVASDALSVYKSLSGWNGVEDDPSDTGLEEYQVFNYWVQTGLFGGEHSILGFIEIDQTDIVEIQTAIWLFENIYRAASLPSAWVKAMDTMTNGFVWDVSGAGNPNDGHAWMGCGYNKNGAAVGTWGMLGLETYASIATYGSTYSVLGPDIIDIASERSPIGVNWTQLVSDFQSLGAIQT